MSGAHNVALIFRRQAVSMQIQWTPLGTTMADPDGYHWYDRKSLKTMSSPTNHPASMDAVRLLPNLAFCQYR